jgi:hypothetical protein
MASITIHNIITIPTQNDGNNAPTADSLQKLLALLSMSLGKVEDLITEGASHKPAFPASILEKLHDPKNGAFQRFEHDLALLRK